MEIAVLALLGPDQKSAPREGGEKPSGRFQELLAEVASPAGTASLPAMIAGEASENDAETDPAASVCPYCSDSPAQELPEDLLFIPDPETFFLGDVGTPNPSPERATAVAEVVRPEESGDRAAPADEWSEVLVFKGDSAKVRDLLAEDPAIQAIAGGQVDLVRKFLAGDGAGKVAGQELAV